MISINVTKSLLHSDSCQTLLKNHFMNFAGIVLFSVQLVSFVRRAQGLWATLYKFDWPRIRYQSTSLNLGYTVTVFKHYLRITPWTLPQPCSFPSNWFLSWQELKYFCEMSWRTLGHPVLVWLTTYTISINFTWSWLHNVSLQTLLNNHNMNFARTVLFSIQLVYSVRGAQVEKNSRTLGHPVLVWLTTYTISINFT